MRSYQPTRIGDPDLFQEWPDVTAVLMKIDNGREQTAAAKGAFTGLDSTTYLPMDPCLPQRSFGVVVRSWCSISV
jgi:hypothetical protein